VNQEEEHLLWSNAVDRLFRSGHASLERHLFLGNRYFGGLPYLFPDERDNPHVWVMGGGGTGKTSRVLAPLLAQHVALGHSAVVLDPKPDKTLFEACRWECEAVQEESHRVPFRYVFITPGRWSYVFAPLGQSHAEAQTIASRAEVLLQSLNLDFGVHYGSSYYTAMDELFCIGVHTLYPDAKTPEAVVRHAESSQALKRHLGDHGWEDSNLVRSVFAKLAGVTPFNPAPGERGFTAPVMDAAIDLRQLFYRPQVVYFALDSSQSRSTTRAAMGLALFNLLVAAKHVGPNPPAKVVCVIDEAQESVGPNLAILMEQARSSNVRLVLSHQNLGQLRYSDSDYQGTFEENTGLQVVFNPVSQQVRRWMEETSGQQLYTTLNWEQDLYPGTDPRAAEHFRPDLARRPSLFEFPRVSVGERLGPVWDQNTLMRLSAEPGVAWVRLTRDQGLARDRGQWVPVRMFRHISPARYQQHRLSAWPGPNGQAVLVERDPPPRGGHAQLPSGPTPGAVRTRANIRQLRARP
jgi:hypothetical protein